MLAIGVIMTVVGFANLINGAYQMRDRILALAPFIALALFFFAGFTAAKINDRVNQATTQVGPP